MFTFMTDYTLWLTIIHSGQSREALGTNPDLVTASLAGMLDVCSYRSAPMVTITNGGLVGLTLTDQGKYYNSGIFDEAA